MTTDLHTAGDAQAARADALARGDAQTEARDEWRRSGGRLTGVELGRRYGRSERWGREQIAAARRDVPTTAQQSHGNGSDANGARGVGGAAIPHVAAPASGGTASTTPAVPAGSRTRAATPDVPAGTRPTPSAGSGSPAAPKGRQDPDVPLPLPLPLLVITTAAVVVVTAVCAVVSYSHIRDLARVAGMGGLAGWLPLGVDGLVVAASCSLIVDRQLGRPGHALAWTGIALGLAGSLAANVLAVDPTLVSLRAVRWVLAGSGPAALAVSGHLLLRMVTRR